MHKLIFLLLVGISLGAAADTLYKWVDKDGNVHYSDEPSAKNAKVLTPPELSAYKPISKSSSPKQAQVDKSTPAPASASKPVGVSILAPQEDETIRSNQGIVTFKVNTGARKKEGDYFKLEMDGKLINEAYTNRTFSVSSIDRGEHKARVFLFDKTDKQIAQTPERIFFLHKASILSPKR